MTLQHDPANARVDALLGSPRPELEASIGGRRDLDQLRQRWAQAEATPVLLADRSQGRDDSWGGLDIRTLLRGEQSAGRFAVHSIVVPPGAGLPLHFQEDAHAYLLMNAGTLSVEVGKVQDHLEPNDFAFVPARTRFAFRNLSGSPCAFTVVYSPAGAERAFKAAHAHWAATRDERQSSYRETLEPYGFNFASQPLENDEKTNAPISAVTGEVKRPGDLEKLRNAFASRLPLPRIVKTSPDEIEAKLNAGEVFRKAVLTGDDSGGEGMFHVLAAGPGFFAPPHHQPTEEEFFFIRRGQIEVVCATATQVVGEGAFSFNPRNCTHGFRTFDVSHPTHLATLNSPAGHERALAAVRELLAVGGSREQMQELTLAGGWIVHEDLI